MECRVNDRSERSAPVLMLKDKLIAADEIPFLRAQRETHRGASSKVSKENRQLSAS